MTSTSAPLDRDAFNRLRASYGRALGSGDLLGRFYELFLAAHPDVRAKFAETNFTKQKRLLNESIMTAIFAAASDRRARTVLDRIRDSHSRAKHDIPPPMYDLWRDCLLGAIAEFDPQFDPGLEQEWRRALEPVIEHVVAGY